MKPDTKPSNVSTYIQSFPATVQKKFRQLQKIIKATAPAAEERISYGLPAYFLNGPLVYFGGFKNHIGFFPTGSGVAAFKKELTGFKHAKGSIRFPIGDPLPATLIKKIVRFKRKENAEKLKQKK